MTNAGSRVSVKNETAIEVCRFLALSCGSELIQSSLFMKVTPPPDQAQAATSTPKSSSKSSVESKSSKTSLKSPQQAQESVNKETSPEVQ